jgi:hypothetical protein
MKKLLLTAVVGLLAQLTIAQTFIDDFEGYNAGDYIGVESLEWTTWSGAIGGTEDAQVVTDQAHSGNNSTYYSSTATTGGPQDVALYFNGEHNTGGFNFKSWFYVESGKGAYFNFQAETLIGQTWAMNCQMNENGLLALTGPSNNPKLETIFTHDTWFELEIDVNLNTNDWELLLDGVTQGVMQNDLFVVASLDIFPVNASNNQSGFWVDDVEYTLTPYTIPALNAGLTLLEPNAELAGMNAKPMVQVRNLGTDTLTSFDVSVEYNGTTINESITGVNLASLETYDVYFTSTLPVIAGQMNVTAVVSNPNGGLDMDADDDVKVIGIDPIIPAPGKMVFVEEGTGTWCQWCPRGAVMMDAMQEKYDQFFAGVAIHNADPMADSLYDASNSAAIGNSYPGGKVDRGATVDPLDFEFEFLDRISVAPETSMEIGAEYDSISGELKVSLTTTFLEAVTGNYRVGVVLVEDGVTGLGSSYNQSNAYAGGANGPMGGYENLPSSVPASQMVYNHVARGIAPSYTGLNGMYTTPVQANDEYTMNVTFQIDPSWNMDEMHIMSFSRATGQIVDNASKVTIGEAEANGFTVGIEEEAAYLGGPDVKFQLYPNPTAGLTTAAINLNGQTDITVEVYSSKGQLVSFTQYGSLNGSNNLFINTSDLSNGMYTVSMIADGLRTSRRLMVK